MIERMAVSAAGSCTAVAAVVALRVGAQHVGVEFAGSQHGLAVVEDVAFSRLRSSTSRLSWSVSAALCRPDSRAPDRCPGGWLSGP